MLRRLRKLCHLDTRYTDCPAGDPVNNESRPRRKDEPRNTTSDANGHLERTTRERRQGVISWRRQPKGPARRDHAVNQTGSPHAGERSTRECQCSMAAEESPERRRTGPEHHRGQHPRPRPPAGANIVRVPLELAEMQGGVSSQL